MTKSDFIKKLLCLVCVIAALFTVSVSVQAAVTPAYENPSTGYRVFIIDDADLLTDSEEKQLAEDMKPLAEYGNIAFWTTTEYYFNEIEQARLKRKELFEFSSGCIFVINMDIRKLTLQSYGTINGLVGDSLARSITDNVSAYASNQQYYVCAKNAFEQVLTVCQQKHISEPLKISGYVVISLMLGLILAIGIAFSRRHNPLLAASLFETEDPYEVKGGFKEPVQSYFVAHTTRHRPPPTISVSSGSSNGSSCSSCSSGSSCSSCSSGSSCSSCGGCGSGGSSSF